VHKLVEHPGVGDEVSRQVLVEPASLEHGPPDLPIVLVASGIFPGGNAYVRTSYRLIIQTYRLNRRVGRSRALIERSPSPHDRGRAHYG
jgi:hypothetical protein